MVMLQKINSELLQRIEFLLNGRKSKTSSTPPSQDIGRSNAKSLRPKSNRRTGGQAGHKGKTLEMTSTPDEIKNHIPDFCNSCGTNLTQEEAHFVSSRQEVELPSIKPTYIEYRNFKKTCTCCGEQATSELPSHLHNSIQYGASVSAAISYLSVYQYLPYHRITDLLVNLFNLPISQGTVQNKLANMSKKAEPLYQEIAQKIKDSKVVGSDETGSHIAGQKGWFFVWQTKTLTYLKSSFSRGYVTIQETFPEGFPGSTLVSDCLPAQLKTPSQNNQLCIAHLMRELANFQSAVNCPWSKKMSVIFQEATALKKAMTFSDYYFTNKEVVQLENRLDRILTQDFSKSHPKIRAFMKRLNKNRNSIFTFLYQLDVPPDNNASERSVRNLKIKTKVSGCFRTEKGANQFAVLRSVVDTAIKNGCNVFQAFLTIAQNPIFKTE